MKRKLAIMFGLLLVIGATLPISAGPALAADHNPVYLALGDSLAVGVGASDWSPGVPSTTEGYVPRFGSFLGIAPTNLGVSGETSSTFISGGQLANAVSAIANPTTDVKVVTLDIGANDLLGELFSGPCASAPGSLACQGAIAGALGTFGTNYGTILGNLNFALNNLDDGGELMVMTFYNPFDGTGNPLEGLVDQALVGTDGVNNSCASIGSANPLEAAKVGLNDIIACLGAGAGALVVDVYPLFDGDALRLTHIGLPTPPFSSSFVIHPNDDGYDIIWDAFKDGFKDGHDD